MGCRLLQSRIKYDDVRPLTRKEPTNSHVHAPRFEILLWSNLLSSSCLWDTTIGTTINFHRRLIRTVSLIATFPKMLIPRMKSMALVAAWCLTSAEAFATPSTSRTTSRISHLFMTDEVKAAPMVSGEELEMMLTEWDQPLVVDAYATW
jgi:hypothetical protein